MIDTFEVRYTAAAREDLLRLFDFLLDRARTTDDFDAAQLTVNAITTAIESPLSKAPLVYRKVGSSPFLREFVIASRSEGYVALDEIASERRVDILAVRHQLEDDYY